MQLHAICLFLGITLFTARGQSPDPNLLEEGTINTFLNERDFTLSADGSEAYFTRSDFSNTLRVILMVKRADTSWSEPTVASFSGTFNDLEPFLSPDGTRLYFASNRDTDQQAPKADYDIWYVQREAGGDWGIPKQPGPGINSQKDEFYPAVASNGNLYFTAEREGGMGSEDIFMAEFRNGSYLPAKPVIGGVNTAQYEFNAYVNPEESLMLFSSYGREDQQGGGDLYVSVRTPDGSWSPAHNLGEPINTQALEYCPFYEPVSETLYFTSTRATDPAPIESPGQLESQAHRIGNGLGNIYRTALPKNQLRP